MEVEHRPGKSGLLILGPGLLMQRAPVYEERGIMQRGAVQEVFERAPEDVRLFALGIRVVLTEPTVGHGDDGNVPCIRQLHQLIHLPDGGVATLCLKLLARRERSTFTVLEQPRSLDEHCVAPGERLPDRATCDVLVCRNHRDGLLGARRGAATLLQLVCVNPCTAARAVDGLHGLVMDHRLDVALHLATPVLSGCFAVGTYDVVSLEPLQPRKQLGSHVGHARSRNVTAPFAALGKEVCPFAGELVPTLGYPTAR
mmetsp:Transcript_93768/g.279866  ORF Transcript_93768/g.279866 Transcript_93768/m.279866 type:complete len:256 (+) Transcript_93768:743-1510(+)